MLLSVPNRIRGRERISADVAARIVRWMRYAQRERGLSQRELAQALGIDESHVSKIFKGERQPGLGVFLRLHEEFNIRLESLRHKDPEEG